MDIKQIENLLRLNNIKPSHHRLRIYQYLIEKKNHPTVDIMYRELIKEIPTLSKTTLYNTLNLFVENKIVHLITIEENETRYDADTSLHGHFKCKDCGEVFDIRIGITEEDFTGLEGFIVEESDVYFKGLCPKCH
ncbi:MAG: transcriptional repressor [Syntrophomonadaceae bacterium]|nr:transcriptional repressor [Syntrophomonadaceae bacterium]